ncbi:hypothetical protein [Nocardioides sp. WS12]|uniref:hypothetical protein n=1 Tax=Nocardioides sp. WS12 TaxID=2486272 RepID=UPI0015FD6F81|nr:hypothetical protein [Nocardioides sp. WS12]
MSFYNLGREYARDATEAHADAAAGNIEAARNEWAQADSRLGPLGELDDPEQLRDFIAGVAREDEDRLVHLLEQSVQWLETAVASESERDNLSHAYLLLGRLHGLLANAAPRPQATPLWRQIYKEGGDFQLLRPDLLPTQERAYLRGITEAVHYLPESE